MLAAVGIVIVTAFIGHAIHAQAEEGPSAQNYAQLAQIKENQKVISKNRESYNLFMQAKQDNEKQISLLGKDGYTVDWSKMELAPFMQGK